jgi:hypothetical protein
VSGRQRMGGNDELALSVSMFGLLAEATEVGGLYTDSITDGRSRNEANDRLPWQASRYQHLSHCVCVCGVVCRLQSSPA